MRVVAISGGKDSTAMALRLAEVETGPVVYLCTPTGDELPDMVAHWVRLEVLLGQPIVKVTNGTLRSWTEEWGAVPNFRMRWCTRVLKIEPCLTWIKGQSERVTLCVGLRADEEERRGIYSDDVDTDFPLRRWGWGLTEVNAYLRERGVKVPKRTDCARCYGQRLDEWYALWRDHRDVYNDAAGQERATGHTFRSAQRDTWPAGLDDLGAEFARGRIPKAALRLAQLALIDQDDDRQGACRVCRM